MRVLDYLWGKNCITFNHVTPEVRTEANTLVLCVIKYFIKEQEHLAFKVKMTINIRNLALLHFIEQICDREGK